MHRHSDSCTTSERGVKELVVRIINNITIINNGDGAKEAIVYCIHDRYC